MSDKMLIVRTEYNWADEMDFPGWEIMSERDLEDAKKKVKKYFDNGGAPFEICVGTNEEIEFESYDDVFGWGFEVEEISASDAEVINRVFGRRGGNITLSEPISRCDSDYDDEDDY